MRLIFITALLTLSIASLGQQQQILNGNFEPTDGNDSRYLAITEKKDGKWHRVLYLLHQTTVAMQGWYLDEKCTIADSLQIWYHDNKAVSSIKGYKNGVMNGTTLEFHDNGMMKDSVTYENGLRKGISLGWDKDGYINDSTSFDGQGNGVQMHMYSGGEGKVYSAGRWIQDTLKNGPWNYYHKNGTVMAKEMYKNGKLETCKCFTETGEPIADELCIEKEAEFKGGQEGWAAFLRKNLDANVPVRKGAPVGYHRAMALFVVGADGSISDIKILHDPGFGMGAEFIRILKKSPKWVPAQQYGRNVKAYRKQPLTFVVQ